LKVIKDLNKLRMSNNMSEVFKIKNNLMETIIQIMTCPITKEIMHDPVQGNDGSTYEREAIITWLTRKESSPTTNMKMTVDDLKVNSNIRFLCDKYHAGQLGDKMNEQKNFKLILLKKLKLFKKKKIWYTI